jgi:hypothetical protein
MFEKEVVISNFFFGMVHGHPYKGFQKIPHIPILITLYQNLMVIICMYGHGNYLHVWKQKMTIIFKQKRILTIVHVI